MPGGQQDYGVESIQSLTLTLNVVPRIPIVDVGVSRTTDSGDSFVIFPETKEAVPLLNLLTMENFPSFGLKTTFSNET